MSNSDESSGRGHLELAGVPRLKWGKWVSEIRVPGTQERLWLGSYSSFEGAGAVVSHDVAMFCLRGPPTSDKLNFPLQWIPSTIRSNMSPWSVQKAAFDARMAIDTSLITSKSVNEDRDDNRSHRNSRNAGDHGSGDSGDSNLTVWVDDYI